MHSLPTHAGDQCVMQISPLPHQGYNVDACTSAVCSYNGECIELDGSSFHCNCFDSFTGPQCEVALEPTNCTGLNCTVNEAGCSGNDCQCVPGYTGKTCEIQMDCSEINYCENGDCVEENGYFLCKCDYGYDGRSCSDVATTMQTNLYSMTTGPVLATVIWQSIAATNIAGAVSGTIGGGSILIVCLFIVLCRLKCRNEHLKPSSKYHEGRHRNVPELVCQAACLHVWSSKHYK
jgi:hypothetical protein